MNLIFKNKTLFIDSLLNTLLVFIIILVFPYIFSFKFFEPIRQTLADFKITDIAFSKLSGAKFNPADEDIVLINTDKTPKNNLAMIISIINEYKPKVIAIEDILKKENEERFYDEILANSLSQVDNLILASRLDNFSNKTKQFTSIKESEKYFNPNSTFGFTNFLVGRDKRYTSIRTFMPKTKINGKEEYAFAVEVARKFDSGAVQRFLERDLKFETINYTGTFNKFYLLNSAMILNGEYNPEIFKNRIVLMGKIKQPLFLYKNHFLENMYFTPLDTNYSSRSFPDMYGLEIHANIITMIIKEKYFNKIPTWISILLAVFLCYLNSYFFSYISLKINKWYEIISLSIFVLESLIILFITVEIFESLKYEFETTVALFAIALSIVIFEGYKDSLKPLAIQTYYKFFKRG